MVWTDLLWAVSPALQQKPNKDSSSSWFHFPSNTSVSRDLDLELDLDQQQQHQVKPHSFTDTELFHECGEDRMFSRGRLNTLQVTHPKITRGSVMWLYGSILGIKHWVRSCRVTTSSLVDSWMSPSPHVLLFSCYFLEILNVQRWHIIFAVVSYMMSCETNRMKHGGCYFTCRLGLY